jgi:hypothetical protein
MDVIAQKQQIDDVRAMSALSPTPVEMMHYGEW